MLVVVLANLLPVVVFRLAACTVYTVNAFHWAQENYLKGNTVLAASIMTFILGMDVWVMCLTWSERRAGLATAPKSH